MAGVLRLSLLAIALGSAVPTSPRAQAPGARAEADAEVAAFATRLARALRNDDRAAVSALVRYPLPVRIGGLRVPFSGPDTLLARYDEIFTPAVRDVIDRAVDRGALTLSTDGFVIGSNAVTVTRVSGRFTITSIVVPPEGVDSGTTGGPGSHAVAGEPRRIAVRGGPRPTRLAGSLAPGGVDTYVVYVPKGQWLQVRVERARREAALRVVHAKSGAPLNSTARPDTTVVSGRAGVGADYRIEVRRVSGDETALPYLLAVTAK